MLRDKEKWIFLLSGFTIVRTFSSVNTQGGENKLKDLW